MAVALALAGLAGCARTAEERQLEAMRADIEDIQRDRDRSDPPAGPEPGARPPPGAPPPGAPPPGAPPQGALAPPTFPPPGGLSAPAPADDGSDEGYADPEDTTPRPKIRVLGAPRPSGRGRHGEEVEQVTDEGSQSVLDPEAKRAYDAALAQVTAKQFGPALEALAAFIVRWPDHPYVDHAMYWRGECYFAQGDFARASEELEGVLARFPAGMKAPDALYKLSLCHQKLGHTAQARSSLERLLRDYPQSEAARHAAGAAAEDRR